MFSFKQAMRKYFTLLYVTFSVMSFAQFTDNVFDKNKTSAGQSASLNGSSTSGAESDAFTTTGSSSGTGVPGAGEQEEGIGPGNPGEPVPINDYIPYLLALGVFLMIYYQVKNKKINI